jgi:hypothetical protein
MALNPDRFGLFILITMFVNTSAVALGLLVGSLLPTVDIANAVGTPIVVIMILFTGFYISIDSLPIVANWLPYISIIRWGFEALCINEYKGLTFKCDKPDLSKCTLTGEEVLSQLGFGGKNTSDAVMGTGLMIVGMLFFTYISLWLNGVKFLPLGFVGSKYIKNDNSFKNAESESNRIVIPANYVKIAVEEEENVADASSNANKDVSIDDVYANKKNSEGDNNAANSSNTNYQLLQETKIHASTKNVDV